MRKLVPILLAIALLAIPGCQSASSATDADIQADDDYDLHIDGYVSKANAEHIVEFDCQLQLDELPTGCEIVSATMLLDHYGYSCEMMELYDLIDCEEQFWANTDGQIVGPDPDYVFIGDPRTSLGYTCNIKPLASAIDSYLDSIDDTSYRAKDITGSSWKQLYALIDQDTPVEILVCGSTDSPDTFERWMSDKESGKVVIGYPLIHAVVLIGYDGDQAVIADPVAGIYETDADELEEEYVARGSYAMIIAPANED